MRIYCNEQYGGVAFESNLEILADAKAALCLLVSSRWYIHVTILKRLPIHFQAQFKVLFVSENVAPCMSFHGN